MTKKNWLNDRIRLAEILPIDTPINVKIEPTRACNFKCVYCSHYKVEWSKELLSKETFDKFINIYDFPNKLKSVTFSGLGEPLLNPHTPYYIKVCKQIADKTILITNGSLLSKEMIDELIEADLDCIRVSMNGLNSEDYLRISGVNFDFDKFLENMTYYYQNKKNTDIWIKLPDIVCQNTDSVTKLFMGKCDKITVNAIQPLYTKFDVDYSGLQLNYQNNVFDTSINKDVVVCSQPFFLFCLIPNGDIYPCAALEKTLDDVSIAVGNVNESISLSNIWGGSKLNKFRLAHLTQTYKNMETCNLCPEPICYSNEFDNIDEEKERLTYYYEGCVIV